MKPILLIFVQALLLSTLAAPIIAKTKADALLSHFQSENANLSKVDIVAYTSSADSARGILVARSTTDNADFKGRWQDELFGIFELDEHLSVVRALQFVPSKRWYDYCVQLQPLAKRQFTVSFFGCMYNDQKELVTIDLD